MYFRLILLLVLFLALGIFSAAFLWQIQPFALVLDRGRNFEWKDFCRKSNDRNLKLDSIHRNHSWFQSVLSNIVAATESPLFHNNENFYSLRVIEDLEIFVWRYLEFLVDQIKLVIELCFFQQMCPKTNHTVLFIHPLILGWWAQGYQELPWGVKKHI